jgi:hypothetical protein
MPDSLSASKYIREHLKPLTEPPSRAACRGNSRLSTAKYNTTCTLQLHCVF